MRSASEPTNRINSIWTWTQLSILIRYFYELYIFGIVYISTGVLDPVNYCTNNGQSFLEDDGTCNFIDYVQSFQTVDNTYVNISFLHTQNKVRLKKRKLIRIKYNIKRKNWSKVLNQKYWFVNQEILHISCKLTHISDTLTHMKQPHIYIQQF